MSPTPPEQGSVIRHSCGRASSTQAGGIEVGWTGHWDSTRLSTGVAMDLTDNLLRALVPGEIRRIVVGPRWTAVLSEAAGEMRCGLAATLDRVGARAGQPEADVLRQWVARPGLEVAARLHSPEPLEVSVAAAAINALLPRVPGDNRDQPAEEIVARRGAGKSVVLVGRFAFAPRLRPLVSRLQIIERQPHGDEVPESQAERVLPEAEFVAITGMAFVNGSLEGLLRWCGAEAEVLVLGPSTPLSPVLFDYGVDLLAGAEVTSIDAVMEGVAGGADFHQLRLLGVRRVCLSRSEWAPGGLSA